MHAGWSDLERLSGERANVLIVVVLVVGLGDHGHHSAIARLGNMSEVNA
jgi:hypothetical protein